ncbi:hypothetical protein XHC_1744 [Xanthomonas hortorum pv. carotae str. M081]|nr:hypothetical protein XHC_1744 [Xanthomonas hortorum pv. carotae str. M081]
MLPVRVLGRKRFATGTPAPIKRRRWRLAGTAPASETASG